MNETACTIASPSNQWYGRRTKTGVWPVAIVGASMALAAAAAQRAWSVSDAVGAKLPSRKGDMGVESCHALLSAGRRRSWYSTLMQRAATACSAPWPTGSGISKTAQYPRTGGIRCALTVTPMLVGNAC